MANKYANLIGTNLIKDEYTKINTGFDGVDADIKAVESAIENHETAADPHDQYALDTDLATLESALEGHELDDTAHGIGAIAQAVDNLEQEVSSHKAENVSDDAHGWDSSIRFKIGRFTRSTTLSASLQQITGIGFKPKAILFLAAVDGLAGRMSIGFSNGESNLAVQDYFNNTANSYYSTNTRAISIQQGSSGNQVYNALISSLDTDGFTLDWRKGSTAADGETITVQYIAFR